jgi:hypothetical protein
VSTFVRNPPGNANVNGDVLRAYARLGMVHLSRQERRARHLELVDRQQKASASRPCGSCSECCTTVAVAKLHKNAGQPCKHNNVDGCSIYNRRPRACAIFNCLWRAGLLGEEDRPDHLGYVLIIRQRGGETFISAMECERGASPGALEKLSELATQLGIAVVVGEAGPGLKELRATGPEDRVRAVMAAFGSGTR